MEKLIDYLADRPDFIPAIAAGTQVQYAELWPERTLEWRIDRLRAHLNRRALPIAWVMHDGQQALGTAALRVTDFPGMDHLTPWLGGVFVFPEFRGHGLGKHLCRRVEQEAIRRGMLELYLGTFDIHAWYGAMGWELFHSGTLQGRPCDVMRKTLKVENQDLRR